MKKLKIDSIAEHKTLVSAMGMVIDMETDMQFDAFPWNARGLRELAEKSDQEINDELSKARNTETARAEKIEAAQALLVKLTKEQ